MANPMPTHIPDTLIDRLKVICETAEAIITDQSDDCLHIAHVIRIRDMAVDALRANEEDEREAKREEREMRRIQRAENGNPDAGGPASDPYEPDLDRDPGPDMDDEDFGILDED